MVHVGGEVPASTETTAMTGVSRSRPSDLRVLVLGPLAVEAGARTLHVGGSHRRRLLALLATRPGRMASIESIVDALWGDGPPPSAAKTVQSHVVRLRRSLGDLGGSIETVSGGYLLAVEAEAIDATRVERLVAEGRELLQSRTPGAAAERFQAALNQWRGPAYVEFRDAEFAAAEGVRLDELHLATKEDLAEAWVAVRSTATAISSLEGLVRNEPGRERSWGLLMRALYAAGRQHDALGAFQRARQVLGESYGLAPGPDLRAIERQILEQDPSLDPTTGRAALAATLRNWKPLIGRASEVAALETAWTMAREGTGQLRILSGPVDAGRTRLAADLAGRAVEQGGDVEYVRAADGLDSLVAKSSGSAPSTGETVDGILDRCRLTPMIVIVDDVEWAPGAAVTTIEALAAAIDHVPLLLLLIVDPSGGGPAVAAITRLDPESARTLVLGPMPDDDIAALVEADGVDDDGVSVVVASAGGRPGVARREAAAWAERTASFRLRAATTSSSRALAMAHEAQHSVLDEVVELVAARARHDEMRAATWTGRQPYRALASYGPQDADVFVGRERLVAELATRVLERRLVVVTGASGSGKSSLVRAGLIPLARSGRLPGDVAWRTHVIVPGRDPVAALDAIQEIDAEGPRLLVVDQFEEAFAAPAAVMEAFVARLLDLAGDPAMDVHVVVVVRADEYVALTGVPGLSDAAQDSQLLVGPPTVAELRRIVEEPARRTGVSVEPALVDLVTHDVGGYDAALPLVSAALAELWEHRRGVELSAEQYVQIGGIATAVERLGEEALARAGDADVDVHRVMLLLAEVTDEGLWIRRRLPIDQVPDDLSGAVDALVAARLVVRTETSVEVVHEVVFRSWPRLASWLAEAHDDLVRERELTVAARAWEAEGRSDDNVYRGARLEAAMEWMARHGPPASPLAGPFLDAGRRWAQRELDESRERLGREVRARQRLTRALAAASLLLVLAIAAGVLALRQVDRADTAAAAAEREAARADGAAFDARRAATLAEEAALSADAERLGASAGLEDELDTSLLLAAQAFSMADTPSTRGALLRSVQRSPQAVGMIRSDGARFLALELSPDGSRLAVNENEGGTALYDVASGDRIGHFPTANVGGLAWSPDGTAFVTADISPDVDPSSGAGGLLVDAVLVDATSLTERARYTGRTGPVSDFAFSPDGGVLVAAPSADFDDPSPGELTVWDVARPGPPTGSIVLSDGTQGFDDPISFDATGTHVAVSVRGATVLIDILTGERIGSYAGSRGLLSPDGTVLAVDAGDQFFPLALELVDVETGARRALQGAHTARIVGRVFSRDGTMLATAGDDRTVRIWDTATGAELHSLSGHTGRVLGAAFSPDGATLYSTGLDRSIITWDLAGRRTIGSVVVEPTAQLHSEQLVVTDDASTTVRVPVGGDTLDVIDLAAGTAASIETGHRMVSSLVAGEGAIVYTSGEDGAVRRWDVSDATLTAERPASDSDGGGLTPLVPAPDGSVLYAQSRDGTLLTLDPETLRSIGPGLGTVPAILTAAVSPDGGRIAMSTFNPPAVALLDLASGVQRSTRVPGEVVALTFSPDGSMLFAGDVDGRTLRIGTEEVTVVGDPVTRHDGVVVNIAVAHDGERFASGGTDGKVGLWEAATGRYVGTVQPGAPNRAVQSRWLSDGHTLLVMYEDGSVFDFDTRPASWFRHACATASRRLSEQEWTELLPARPYDPACD